VAGELSWFEGKACFVAESMRGASETHGLHSFGDLASVIPAQLAALNRDPELAYSELGQAVFLDTETTGLGMGTGTYVFLVGAGYFDSGTFRVKQFFLRDPAEELPFLTALTAFLGRFSTLVTFNGKAFDWPLLESRFVGQRRLRRAPLDDPLHIDLLHPARRLWKRRLESCALSSLEKSILGVARSEEDVPGWLIPSLYFRYVHSGDARYLRGVFYHNLHDVLSLAALTVHIDKVLDNPFGGLVHHPVDFLCLGKLFDREGATDLAVACLEEAVAQNISGEERTECLERMAMIHKRERRWDSALLYWDRLVDEGGPGTMRALVQRAKYYEHVERDYVEALNDVQRAVNLLELDGSLSRAASPADLDHRRSRLVNRVLRQQRWGSERARGWGV
jgi:uncharacterized protein YprB with RNaseH-like and TPR domain